MNVVTRSSPAPPTSERTQIGAAASIRRDERQRIGRELHDSTSQLLVALQLNLACLKASSEQAANRELFCALDQTLQELHSAVRAVSSSDETLSLQEILPLALSAMATHFRILANIKVTLDIQGNYVPQAAEVEMSLYRIAQEALANVARHSHATEVRLQLDCTKSGTLKLTIEDNGVGFGSGGQADLHETGTGIGNIRQRVHDMGGYLLLKRLRRGSRVAVTIRASLPDSRPH